MPQGKLALFLISIAPQFKGEFRCVTGLKIEETE